VSSGLATGLVLALYALAMVPVAWMWRRPKASRLLAPGLGAALSGLAFVQTGILQSSQLTSTDLTGLAPSVSEIGRCTRVLNLLTEAGVILGPVGGEDLVVNGADWDRLPTQVRDVTIACAKEMSSNNADERDAQEIEVIKR
jgi:hypothetical protein